MHKTHKVQTTVLVGIICLLKTNFANFMISVGSPKFSAASALRSARPLWLGWAWAWAGLRIRGARVWD